MTEDEMVGWQHWLNGHEFESTPGDGWWTRRPGMLQSMGLQSRLNWILTGVKWHLIVVLICISLTLNIFSSHLQHLQPWTSFHVLLTTCMSSLENCLGLFPTFWLGSFVFLVSSCMSCLYVLEINPLSVVHLLLFSPILRVDFPPGL